MSKRPRDTRTWTTEEVVRQERVLEARVGEAQEELDQAKARHRTELAALRKFRKAKITHASQIVPVSCSVVSGVGTTESGK